MILAIISCLYEKYAETCLHVKEDFRKEKTLSAWDRTDYIALIVPIVLITCGHPKCSTVGIGRKNNAKN
jgi:hypothetical protein